MIVRFSTRHGQLTMLGEPAVLLLRLGGHSGTVPGAVIAADLPSFLARLRAGLVVHGEEPSPVVEQSADLDSGDADDGPRERPISLRFRALPLLDMIETAVARSADLMWDRG